MYRRQNPADESMEPLQMGRGREGSSVYKDSSLLRRRTHHRHGRHSCYRVTDLSSVSGQALRSRRRSSDITCMASAIPQRQARPDRIRVRLWDVGARGALPLALPARSMRAVSLLFAISFGIFAVIEWTTIASMFGRSVDDVFDLTFLLFQG